MEAQGPCLIKCQLARHIISTSSPPSPNTALLFEQPQDKGIHFTFESLTFIANDFGRRTEDKGNGFIATRLFYG